jgi:hypothetical protein
MWLSIVIRMGDIMERLYKLEVLTREDSVVLKLTDGYGEKEFYLTSEHAQQLSLTLETAVDRIHHDRFKLLPKISIESKSGEHWKESYGRSEDEDWYTTENGRAFVM